MNKNIYFWIKLRLTLLDLQEIFLISHKTLEFPIRSKVMIKKTAEKCQNFNDAEKLRVSKLSKISIQNFDKTILRLEL